MSHAHGHLLPSPTAPRRWLFVWGICLPLLCLILLAGGCRTFPGQIQGVTFNATVVPRLETGPIVIKAARNETVSFGLQISDLAKSTLGLYSPSLYLGQMHSAGDASIDISQYAVYQVLDMPVDLNRAGFARHTGLDAVSRKLPLALLPLAVDQGAINLAALRDPLQPLSPEGRFLSRSGQTAPLTLWVDLAVPTATVAGPYKALFEIRQNHRLVASIEVQLNVYDFVIPDERHLQMAGRLDWPSLVRLYPDWFETVAPSLLNRTEPRYVQAIKVLDQAVQLAHDHRLNIVIPRLQPQVKWPASGAPQISWADFDSLVAPWLGGEVFADHIPLGYWPLPTLDYLDRYDRASQKEYWAAAAGHFDQLDWLSRSPLTLTKSGPVETSDSLALSLDAADLLTAYSRMRLAVPLSESQLQFQNAANPKLLNPAWTQRLIAVARGLVSQDTGSDWPAGAAHPAHILSVDVGADGLVPYFGAGGAESDVRLWAWLAFLREDTAVVGREPATIVLWGDALAGGSSGCQPVNPDAVTWYYPGAWFGVDVPVPSVQLKWLRRAELDYEYLYLSRHRGETDRALAAARLIARPVDVQFQPDVKQADPTYALLCGVTDPSVWDGAMDLLARTILLHKPGEVADHSGQLDLDGRIFHWIELQERPQLLARTAGWGWSAAPRLHGNWVDMRLGLDIYNAAEQRLTGRFQWTSTPGGWQFNPKPTPIAPTESVDVFSVRRFAMDAAVNLDQVGPEMRQPIEVGFRDDRTGRTSLLRLALPVAGCEARQGLPIRIDGVLDDWSEADAIHQGPLVKLLNRPGLQRQELQFASTASSLYSSWSPGDLYLAFKLDGLSPYDGRTERNFADYQFRRAWGEDLCEVLMQPVYPDNTIGPLLHLVCKPRGQIIVESRLDSRRNINPWQVVAGANVRYAANIEAQTWRAELAIPWTLINDAKHQGMPPALLRFNFVQHKSSTGESASWAGPVDYGRDDTFMGLLHVHDPQGALPIPGKP